MDCLKPEHLGKKKKKRRNLYKYIYVVSCLTTGSSSEPNLKSTFLATNLRAYGDVILHLLI